MYSYFITIFYVFSRSFFFSLKAREISPLPSKKCSKCVRHTPEDCSTEVVVAHGVLGKIWQSL